MNEEKRSLDMSLHFTYTVKSIKRLKPATTYCLLKLGY